MKRILIIVAALMLACDPSSVDDGMATESSTADSASSSGEPNDGESSGEDVSGSSTGGELPTLGFESDILPIFAASCVMGCHEAGGVWSTLPLDSAESFDALFDTGVYGIATVEPGDPQASMLWRKVSGNQDASGTAMPPPPSEPLPQDEIDRIEAWIAQGAPR